MTSKIISAFPRFWQRPVFLIVGAWLALIVTTVITVATDPAIIEMAYSHADFLYLPALFQSLTRGDSLADWVLPRSPFIFPDLVVFFALNALFNDFRPVILLYAILQYLSIVAGMAFAAAQMARPRWIPYVWVLLAGVAGSIALRSSPGVQANLFLTLNHTGTIIIFAWSVGLFAYLLRKLPNVSWKTVLWVWLALFVLISLTVLSDFLFIVVFVAPALLSVAVLLVLRRLSLRFAALLFSLLVGATGVGYVLFRVLIRFPTNSDLIQLSAASLINSARLFLLWAKSFLEVRPVLAMDWLAFMTIAGAILLWLVRRKQGAQSIHSGVAFVIAVLFFSPLLNFLAAILTNNLVLITSNHPSQPIFYNQVLRYLMATLLIPLFLGWPVLLGVWPAAVGWLSQPRGILVTWAATALLVLVFMVQTGKPTAFLDNISRALHRQDDLAQCIDKQVGRYHLQAGIAGYWQALRIEVYSRYELPIARVEGKLAAMQLQANLQDFVGPYDFIVAEPHDPGEYYLPESKIIEMFGNPVARFVCSYYPVLVYNHSDNAALRNYHFSGQIINKWRGSDLPNVGDQAAWPARALPSSVGDKMGRYLFASAGHTPQGYLSYGPYASLSRGEYTFRLIGYAVGQPGDNIGVWDVNLISPDGTMKVIQSGEFRPNTNQTVGTFSLEADGIVEVRAFFRGAGTLSIEALQITRME